jgi:antitoxin component HigA of HigAB toxin-antitoxin module
MMSNSDDWHLSKSVPVPFILAIVAQTIALVWYVSSLDNDVENNTRDLLRHEVRLEALEKIVQSQALTLARMDENIKAIRTSVEKMAAQDTEL